MSLVQKPKTTEKELAANRRNQKLAHGPATEKGWERIRAARSRHGFYAQAEEVASRARGEDPAQHQELLAGLWQTYHPTDAAQEGLVIRLARATWLQIRPYPCERTAYAENARLQLSGSLAGDQHAAEASTA